MHQENDSQVIYYNWRRCIGCYPNMLHEKQRDWREIENTNLDRTIFPCVGISAWVASSQLSFFSMEPNSLSIACCHSDQSDTHIHIHIPRAWVKTTSFIVNCWVWTQTRYPSSTRLVSAEDLASELTALRLQLAMPWVQMLDPPHSQDV